MTKKSEKGALSIFLVIVLPILLSGILMLYLMFYNAQQKLAIQKISYACSETYLSILNSYLFDNFGLPANKNEDVLEQMIRYYLKENELVKSTDDFEVDVVFMDLSKPSNFRKTILEAASISITKEAVEHTLEMLSHSTSFEGIKNRFKRLSETEIKISGTMEQLNLDHFATQISQQNDPEKIGGIISAAFSHISSVKHNFQTLHRIGVSELDDMLGSTDAIDKHTFEAIHAKRAEWKAIEQMFNDLAKALESNLNEASELLLTFETVNSQDDLGVLLEQLLSRITMHEKKEKPDLIERVGRQLIEVERMISGVALGDSALDFSDVGQFAPEYDKDKNATLIEKVLINEYFFSVFSNYDLNCPRKISLNRRNESKRRVVGEIEYLITGRASEVQSLGEIKLALFGLRFVSNLISILSDKEKHMQIAEVTVLMPQPWRTIAYSSIITLWCGSESYSDTNRLLKGEGLDMIKSGSQWTFSLNRILDLNDSDVSSHNQTGRDVEGGWVKLYYQDYLRILLIMKAEEVVLARAMDLINLEIHALSKGAYGLEKFSIGHEIVMFFNSGYKFTLINEVSR